MHINYKYGYTIELYLLINKEDIMKAICPNNCSNNEFIVIAHVSQSWKVDNAGNFIQVLDQCIDVIHHPDISDVWICSQCGHEAIFK